MFYDKGFLFARLLLPVSFIITGFILFVSLEGCNSQNTSVAAKVNREMNDDDQRRVAVDVGIVVTNMEASLSFYQDLLGLRVVAEVRTSLIGAGTMVQLEHGESLIKLIEMDDPPSAEPVRGIAATFGHRYITLMVPDIAPYVSRFGNVGIPVVMPLTVLGNGAKIMMIEDPDGNIVEFVQEPV